MTTPRPPLTHFLCLPLITPSSSPKFSSFLTQLKHDVPSLCRIVGSQTPNHDKLFLEQAIRPLGTLHLTLGVMSLTTEERLAGAVELLRALEKEWFGGEGCGVLKEGIVVSFDRLESMREASSTSVVYIAPDNDSSDDLLNFCLELRRRLTEAGYLIVEDRELKLHVTVINTIYVKKSSIGRGGRARNRGRLTIDATELLDRYQGAVDIKDVRLEKVAICKMGARKIVDGNGNVVGEEYEKVGSIRMP